MRLRINNITEIRKFVNGYYWYFGLRLAFAVLLPSIILYHYGILNQYALIPFGTLNIGLTDVVGSLQRRIGAMFIGILCFFGCALLAGYTRDVPWLQLALLLMLAFVFSLIGVYGTRMINIGTTSIITAIFFMDKHFVPGNIMDGALWMTLGCGIYVLVFFVSYKLRPYKLIQQMLGEHIIEVARFLSTRSRFYQKNISETELMNVLIREQVNIREQQENLREIILKTNVSADKFSARNRGLLLMFVDTIDLFELIMTSQQDYHQLHRAFDDTHILLYFEKYIRMMSDELEHIGLAVQSGKAALPKRDLDVLFNKVSGTFYHLRKEQMNHDNVEDFIMLRQILYTLQALNERVKKLYSVAAFNKDVLQAFKSTAKDFASFVPEQNYDYHLFFNSFSFKSGMFRHALRVTVALLIGWTISNILRDHHVGHIYWILMTIVIVVKPAYSQSRIKNLDRILGTIIGGIISLVVAYYVHNETTIFVLVLVATLITCTFSKINYRFYTIGITMLVILSYYYLVPGAVTEVLTERLLNTVTGIVIGYLVSLFVLPNWENKYVQDYLSDMIKSSRDYFSVAAKVFAGETYEAENIKLARRKALIALANLSDNFQRMQSDPKRQQQNVRSLFRLVSINHTLTSYIVSLAQYAKTNHQQYPAKEFVKIVQQIVDNFDVVQQLPEDKTVVESLKTRLPDNENLDAMLHEARMQLRSAASAQEKNKITSIRKSITDYRTVNELFGLINTSVCDEAKLIADTGFNS